MLPKKLYTQGSDESDQNVVSFITGDFSNDGSELDESVLLETIPILPLRNTIVFPGSGSSRIPPAPYSGFPPGTCPGNHSSGFPGGSPR